MLDVLVKKKVAEENKQYTYAYCRSFIWQKILIFKFCKELFKNIVSILLQSIMQKSFIILFPLITIVKNPWCHQGFIE